MLHHVTSFDLETVRFHAGLQAPPPVCLAYDAGSGPSLVPTDEIYSTFLDIVDKSEIIEGHNVAYDLLCLMAWYPVSELVFRLYEEDRVVDTMVRQRAIKIEGHSSPAKNSLEAVAQWYGFPPPNKEDGTRTSYGPLLNQPLSAYSPEHVSYALADANITYAVGRVQRESYPDVPEEAVKRLTRKAFYLALIRTWGMRTDPSKHAQLSQAVTQETDRLRSLAQEAGFVREDGTRDMRVIKAAVRDAYDGAPPITDTGLEKLREPGQHTVKVKIQVGTRINRNGRVVPVEETREITLHTEADAVEAGYIATDRVTLEDSHHPDLEAFAEFGQWNSIRTKDLPLIEAGLEFPISSYFGLADSTRTTSSKPNLQNLGRIGGVRECFVPRPGCAFLGADYGALEMCTLAQLMIWVLQDHLLADEINAGIDPHSKTASDLAHVTYEQFIANPDKALRDLAKVPNFGKPGGMANKTLISYARGLKPRITISEEEAERLGRAWERARPDVVRYLRQYVRSLKQTHGLHDAPIPGSGGLVRRKIRYCAAANTGFQGLGAQVVDEAGWLLVQETHRKNGRMRDSRIANVIHDEFLVEVPVDVVHERGIVLRETMIEAAARLLPDIQITVDMAAMDRWSKNAKAIYENGRLQIWNA